MKNKEEIATDVKRKIEEAIPIVDGLLKKYGKIRRALTAEENIAYLMILGLRASVDESTSYLIRMRARFENVEELEKFDVETRRAIQKEVDRTLSRTRFLGKYSGGRLVRKPTSEQVDRSGWKRILKERELMQLFANINEKKREWSDVTEIQRAIESKMGEIEGIGFHDIHAYQLLASLLKDYQVQCLKLVDKIRNVEMSKMRKVELKYENREW